MDIFEQKKTLNSLRVIHDTREQQTERAMKRYASFGVPHEKGTLNYGDYTFNADLPSGTPIYKTDETISPCVVVERKMNIDELAACFGTGRKRFEREFQRAAEHGARIYLLIENASYEKILTHRYRSRLHPAALIASLFAWSIRYQMIPIMCKEETSGRLIHEILFRELKERIENGEFG